MGGGITGPCDVQRLSAILLANYLDKLAVRADTILNFNPSQQLKHPSQQDAWTSFPSLSTAITEPDLKRRMSKLWKDPQCGLYRSTPCPPTRSLS